jgi:hypothetical protein
MTWFYKEQLYYLYTCWDFYKRKSVKLLIMLKKREVHLIVQNSNHLLEDLRIMSEIIISD